MSSFYLLPSHINNLINTEFLPQYSGVLPFFIKVEGPDECRQGEQLGLRVVVFNYQPQAIEAVVVLAASADYKFVHVEENGIVSTSLLSGHKKQIDTNILWSDCSRVPFSLMT